MRERARQLSSFPCCPLKAEQIAKPVNFAQAIRNSILKQGDDQNNGLIDMANKHTDPLEYLESFRARL
jgi:hypothetical protein